MARDLGDQNKWLQNSCKRDTALTWCVIDVGATGAPTQNTGSCPDWTVSRNSAGNYSVTFPPVPAQTTSGAFLEGIISKSAAPTVTTVSVTAVNYTAGTATVVTTLGGATAADPANGDQFVLQLTSGFSGTF